MAVLLIAEVAGSELSLDQTSKAVTAAKSLGDITVLCAGDGCDGAAAEAAKIDGVAKVLCASDAAYGNGLAENLASLVVSLSADYEHIVAPATSVGKNTMPRVAALLDAMVISDITGVPVLMQRAMEALPVSKVSARRTTQVSPLGLKTRSKAAIALN